jgi:hypothetical protein
MSVSLPRSSFDGYERIARVVGSARVRVVSADLIWERNSTITAYYLICNASLRRSGNVHTLCDQDVSRLEATYPRRGATPPSLLCDAMRMARLLYLSDCNSNDTVTLQPEWTMTHDAMLEKSSAILPQTCTGRGNDTQSPLVAISKHFDYNFLRSTRAQLPNIIWSNPLCLIDQARLTGANVHLIRYFLALRLGASKAV